MFALLLTQVHFSMASDPLQLLRGANRPTKSMMPYYVDAVPVEEAFTKHVPPSLVSIGVTSMVALKGHPLPQGAFKVSTLLLVRVLHMASFIF
jgi:hypothetical protein